MNEGSFNETPATPVAGQNPENCCNDCSVTVAETVMVSTLSKSSKASRSVDAKSNMPAVPTRD